MIEKLARAFSKLRGEVQALSQRIDSLPEPKDGRDGVSPKAEDIAALVLEQIPTPKDGVSPKAEDIAALVLAQIPAPKDGAPGKDAQPPALADVAALVAAQMPKPENGKDGKNGRDGKDGKNGRDGRSPTATEVAAALPAPERGPQGKEGRPGKDGASVTDVRLDKNNTLFVWLDGVKKRVGRIDVPVPQFMGGGGGSPRPSPPQPVSGEVQYTEELRAVSDVDQNPVGTNNPLTVTFGPAQGGPSDPIQLDADGVITVNETGLYQVRFSAQYGRVGASGTSWLYFRTLIAFDGVNYVQVGRTVLVKLSNANEDLGTQNISTIQLQQGWKTKVEIMRGSEGNNSGGLIATVPAEGSWTPSYSAEATVQKIEWAQT